MSPAAAPPAPLGAVRRSIVLRVLPERLVSDSVYSSIDPEADAVIYLSPSTLASLTRTPLAKLPVSYFGTLRRLAPPNTSGIPTAKDGSNPDASTITPLSNKVLQPKDGNTRVAAASKVDTTGKAGVENVALRSMRGIPERHAIVRGQFLGSDVGDWDLIASVWRPCTVTQSANPST